MRKQVKITPRVSNELLAKGLMKLREEGEFSRFRKAKEPFDNQIDCALDILCTFSNKRPRHNYVVVKGNTQSGKTGVFISLINIIYSMKLYASYLNINKIFYITGDNSVKIKDQTEGSIVDGCFQSIEQMAENGLKVYICKQSDMKNPSKWMGKQEEKSQYLKVELNPDGTINSSNSLIFIDESHYGSSKEKNILPSWLRNGGLSLRNDSNLIKKHVYIISNSATPYTEIESDVMLTKQYVTLKPGKGYKGLWDFNYDFVEKDIFGCDSDTVKNYLSKWYRHLSKIEKDKHKIKCAVVRIDNRKFERNKSLIGDYFDIKEINSSKGNIDYEAMETIIMSYCNKPYFGRTKINGTRKKKFLMIVVKGALRMGVRIEELPKNHIGVIYDFTSGPDNIAATEQGLWGRICGYRKRSDYKDTLVCVNKRHGEALLNFYNNEGAEIAKTPFKFLNKVKTEWEYAEDKKGDFKEEYLKTYVKGQPYNGWKPTPMRYDFANKVSDCTEDWNVSPQEWFESKVGTDFFKGIKKFKMSDLQIPNKPWFNTFLMPFLIEQDEYYKRGNAMSLEQRRWRTNDKKEQRDINYCESFGTSRLLTTSSEFENRFTGVTGTNNIGKNIFAVLFDVRDLKNIKVKTITGELTWGRKKEVMVDGKGKISPTMDTSQSA